MMNATRNYIRRSGSTILVAKSNIGTTQPSNVSSHLSLSMPRQYLQRILFTAGSTGNNNGLAATTSSSYNFAITRSVPKSFVNAVVEFASPSESSNHIDHERSQEQHNQYVKKMRKIIPTINLPADDNHPDCCFVEDTTVCIGKTAVITNPGHPSRKGEVDKMKIVLEQLGMNIVDMREYETDAGSSPVICDGGDVMHTGRHLFVGVSARTNMAAVDVLANAFSEPGVETIAVPFDGGALHLKSIVTHIDSHTLLVPTGPLGDSLIDEMKAIERGYECVRLPNMLACNVVSANGTLLAQDNGCLESRKILQETAKSKGLKIEFSDLSELAKADAALTCCSVLLSL